MAGESIVRDAVTELGVKAALVGPTLIGAAVAGPVGAIVGFATGVAIVNKVSSSLPSGDDQSHTQ